MNVFCFLVVSACLLSQQAFGFSTTPGKDCCNENYFLLKKNVSSHYVSILFFNICILCVFGVAFEKYRSALPSDFNVVEAGGWNNVVKLSEDPKTELVSMIAASIKNQEPMDDTKVAALVGLLHARGKGFSSSLVDGDWIPVYSKQAKKSNKAQKIVSRTEKGGTNAYSNFLVQKMIFENINYTPRKNGILQLFSLLQTPACKLHKHTHTPSTMRTYYGNIINLCEM